MAAPAKGVQMGQVVDGQPIVTTGVVVQTPALAPVAPVTAAPAQYPADLMCWDNCQCSRDIQLCCYVCACPYCAYADIMANIEVPTCCCPVGFCPSLACVAPMGFVSFILWTVMFASGILTPCASFVNVVPWVTCTSREALGQKYGLPTEDCGCPCCAHYCCLTCALYQESVYVKHVLQREPTCCCYQCCACCGQTPVGKYPKALGAPGAPDATIQQQPTL